ncbi:MFS transporter [Amycolatopsis cihanbeyliensis]|uniref:Putative MFS family arabinose efflux permease n=1 Tax=Amycolatopsis cihanbeyliensis TaxID=1128664 RepID=A0A542DLW6_AMYCI|nr:MFS transporter [Amycolatopsis cihanbeyliensis]TQJ03975.1 putative MFS family arabinose efflux permease [Amycolatopsis cihanbeyliensis]
MGSRGRSPRLGSDFGKLWAANLATNIADGVAMAAGPLLAISLTGNPTLIAGTVFVQQLPWLLFSLISGVYVDRLDRRKLIAVVDLLRGVVIGGLAIAVWSGVATIAVVYLAFFLVGTAETLADNASGALLPSIVGAEALPRANARLIATQQVADELAAPPLGAALFALGTALPFGVNAAGFVVAALLVSTIRGGGRTGPVERRPLRAEIGEGLRWLWHNQVVRMLALSICAMNVTLLAAFAILVLYARERLGLAEIGFGLLLSAMAVGGLIGAGIASRLRHRFTDSVLLRTGLIVETGTHVLLALAETPWLAVATLVLFGMHGAIWGVVATTWRQRVVPEHLRGRVNSVYLLFAVGGAALGSLVSGPLVSAFDVTAPFWLSAVLMAVVTAVAWPYFGRHLLARPGALSGA